MDDTIAMAERSILGAMLLSREAVNAAEERVNPADFREPRHETIFNLMMGLRQQGATVDIITVGAALMKSPLGQQVGPTYLHDLIGLTPSASSVDYYAELVAKAAIRRRLRVVGTQLTAMAESNEGDEFELVEQARAAIDATRPAGDTTELHRIGDIIKDAFDRMDEPVTQVLTPWPQVNAVIGGMRPGKVYVVGARPSVGKSVMALQLALRLSIRGACAFESLEMDMDELAMRVAAQAKINHERLTAKQPTDEELARAAQAQPHWDRANLYVRSGGGTLTDLQRHVRSVSRTGLPLSGVVIDYLQLIEQPSGDKRPRHEYVADISRRLKLMAQELHVPVIVLSQLNRNSTSREDTMPKISELRESGAIEQDADVIMLMHREIQGDMKNDLAVLVAKNRGGRTGAADLTFEGHYARITDPTGVAK